MKKVLLLSCLFLCGIAASAQPTPSTGAVVFTPGNLVIYRFNDNGTSTGIVPGFIDEITPNGALVRSVPMPTVAAGANRRFMAGLFGQGREGLISLSGDGQYLSVFGVDGPRNGTDYANYPKVIGRISYTGEVNTSTAVSTSDFGNVGRQVTSQDGSGFFGVSGQGQIRYAPLGFNTGVANADLESSYIIGGTVSNFAVKIFNNKLYVSGGSPSASNIKGKIGLVSDTIPKPTANLSPVHNPSYFNLPPSSAAAADTLVNPNDFVLLDRNNDGTPDLLYVIDNATANPGTTTVRKYAYAELVPGVGVWSSLGAYTHAKLNHGRAIAGKIVGTDVQLYIATSPATGKPTIARINDPINGTMSTTAIKSVQPAPDINASGIITTILYASEGYTFDGSKDGATVNFRGIAFAPELSATQPVKLTSFTGTPIADAVELKWSTASETKNSHFEILRSGGNSTFDVLGRVNGNGTTSKENTYSFTDKFPLSGTNYYQLKQVDLDGTSENSKVIDVNYGINGTTFKAYFLSDSQIQLGIYSAENAEGQVKLTDINGRIVFDAKVALRDSNNMITLNTGNIAKGVYVLSLTTAKEAKSLKLLK